MPLHYLIYESRATRLFTEAELAGLLERSRAHNAARGLTGLLLYASDGRMVQVLEGERATIHALHYDHIARDPRHQQLRVLADEPLDRRRFADWRMGYRAASLELLTQLRGYSNPPEATFVVPTLAWLPYALLDKLSQYVQCAPPCSRVEVA